MASPSAALVKNTQQPSIQFIDLQKQQAKIRSSLEKRILGVLDHGKYIMGPEVKEFEAKLSQYCGVKHSIACSNGTDALALGLRAFDVGPGDAVFVPSFTFAATAEVVTWFGATPVFVDIHADTFNIDTANLLEAIETAKKKGLNPKGIIPVDLFGQPADYDSIEKIAGDHNLWIIADAAQSFGGTYKGRKAGSIGHIATTSFFPAKPLGCYGDGGAVFTNDDELAAKIQSMRVHGKGSDKYDNVRIGMNARLDTMQAAILLEKLAIFDQELSARQSLADKYNAAFKDICIVPTVMDQATSSWAQYTLVFADRAERDMVAEQLKTQGVPTNIYYVKPLHQQTAYNSYPTASDAPLPVCEDLAGRVLSLPMSGYVDEDQSDYIIESLLKIMAK
ncbi:MAG: DegT/DnrJ/EryC1/StrS family aminotransferase [Alphaproteobacteria bacterium]